MPSELSPFIEALRKKACTKTANKDPTKLFDYLNKIKKEAERSMLQEKYNDAYVYYYRWKHLVDFLKTAMKKDEKKLNLYYARIPSISEIESIQEKVLQLETKLRATEKAKLLEIEKNNENAENKSGQELELPEIPKEEPTQKTEEEFLPSQDLFNKIKSKSKDFLLIDTRKTEDYNKSMIKTERCVHIPENIIQKGILVTSLAAQLKSNAERNLFEERKLPKMEVILMDWFTKASPGESDKIFTLKDIFLNWDQWAMNKDVKIYYLKGGFSDWLTRYPQFVTDANVEIPSDNLSSLDEILGDIDYQSNWLDSLDENQVNNINHKLSGTDTKKIEENNKVQPPQPVKKFSNIPTIDRSKKPSATSNDNTEFINMLEQLENCHKTRLEILKSCVTTKKNIINAKDEKEIDDLKAKFTKLDITNKELIQEEKNLNGKIELIKFSQHATNKVSSLNMGIGKLEKEIKSTSLELSNLRVEKPAPKPEKIEDEEKPRDYKMPLKTTETPRPPGLTRSSSSPNLAQKNTPAFDRSSKPPLIPANDATYRRLPKPPQPNRLRDFDAVFMSNRQPGITGLKNLTNSCYMNSIIQCLSNTMSLQMYFNNNDFQTSLNRDGQNVTEGRVAEEFGELIKQLWHGQYKSISPHSLKSVLGKYKEEFGGLNQQDSHEFFTFLLEWIHNDLKKKVKDKADQRYQGEEEKAWETAMEAQESIISKLFCGQLKSSIECKKCRSKSTNYEMFNSLHLTLPASSRCTLEECIEKFVSKQPCDWKCDKCKCVSVGSKKYDVVKLPPVLVLHLGRFETARGIEKNGTSVVFPLELNLARYVESSINSNQERINYSLYATSNHSGTMDQGHYIAFCKGANQKWHKFDDQTVSEASPDLVRQQQSSAYLLFYVATD